LLIRLLSFTGVLLTISCLCSFNGSFLFLFSPFIDNLSIRIIWLTRGLVLAILSGGLTKRSNLLWWWISLTLLIAFSSTNLFCFYIFFELRLVPILIIIISRGNQPERLSAGSYLLFYTTAVSVPYLVVILILDLSGLYSLTQRISWRFRGISVLLLLPFFIKIPLFGFHFWLPKAHVEARTSGSIVLAGMLLKLGRYGAARIITSLRLSLFCSWTLRVWVVLALISRVLTFIQRDLKKIVAYRSVTHITFIVVGFFSITKIVIFSVVLVSLSHGWVAIALFSRAGTLRHSASSRLGTLLGSESRLLWFFIIIGLILVSNAGIPPILSFFPEIFLVLLSIRNSGHTTIIFLFLRIGVCYYNAYFFIWISHLKSSILLRIKISFLERKVIFSLLLVRFESLLWLQLF